MPQRWLAGVCKGRALRCASGLTQASPPLHWEGLFQLTGTEDHKSQWPSGSMPSEQSFLLGRGLGHITALIKPGHHYQGRAQRTGTDHSAQQRHLFSPELNTSCLKEDPWLC